MSARTTIGPVCSALSGSLLAVLAATPCYAAPPEANAAWVDLAKTSDIQARFESVQTRSILAAPQRATGSFLWSKPDKLRWSWEAPFPSTFVLNGSRVAMSYPELGVTEQLDLGDNPETLRLVRGITVWMGSDLSVVERDYNVAWANNTATLTPRDPAMEKVFATLDVRFAGEPPRPVGFTLRESEGDSLDVKLLSFERVPPIAPTQFELAQ